MLKEKKEDFAERLKGETVIADKGYASKDLEKWRGEVLYSLHYNEKEEHDKER